MATVTLAPNIDDYIDNLALPRIEGLQLDFQGLLENADLDMLDDIVELSSTRIAATFASLDPFEPILYTLALTGSGIGPVSDIEDLFEALDDATATGAFDAITLEYGSIEILRLDLAPESFLLTSGDQSIALTGGFPVTLSEIFDLIEIFSVDYDTVEEALAQLSGYGFTGLTLRDAGDVLASFSVDDGLAEVFLDGYQFTLTGADIDLNALVEFFDPPRSQIVPVVRIFDSAGEEVTEGVSFFSFSEDGPNIARVELFDFDPGIYYLEVSASADPAGVDWQAQTGQYRSFMGGWDSAHEDNPETREDMGDAPADITTPYELFPAKNFTGAIDFVGDVDWIRLDLTDLRPFLNPIIDTFGTGPIPPDVRDLAGIAFESLVITAPDGVELLRAENIANPGQFIELVDIALEGFGLPPLPDVNLAFAMGDPHLLTLDGVGYDFHAAGEYVLTRATDSSDFQVQARMEPVGENVTANTAVAVQLHGGPVMISARGPDTLLINGEARTIPNEGFVSVGHDRVYRDGDTYMIVHTRDGSMDSGFSAVVVTVVGDRVDIGIALDTAWQGNVTGLLGNFDGDASNDLVLADGTPLTQPLVFGDDPEAGVFGVYGQFREDWRVSDAADSLFTYGPGEGPDSFYLPDYPTAMISLDDFDAEARAGAEAAAEAAGLTPGTFAFNNAVLDLLLTGDESYLDAAQEVSEAVTQREDSGGGVSVPESAGGGLEGLLTLSGQITDFRGDDIEGARVTFQPTGRAVALTRMSREEGEFGFDLMASDTGGLLNATRAHDPVEAGRPTVFDALDVLRLAVGLEPSFGEASAAAYLAADMDGNGQIDVFDALEVLRAAVGLESENAPRWIFVDSDILSEGMDRTSVATDRGVEIGAITEGMADVSLTGILTGHLSEFG
ncbi:MAG: VWD domain-containing protein [Rhodobacteraceae bacterium]|nr:VWD domain-containing protein [Paracoccaceae bacterium]